MVIPVYIHPPLHLSSENLGTLPEFRKFGDNTLISEQKFDLKTVVSCLHRYLTQDFAQAQYPGITLNTQFHHNEDRLGNDTYVYTLLHDHLRFAQKDIVLVPEYKHVIDPSLIRRYLTENGAPLAVPQFRSSIVFSISNGQNTIAQRMADSFLNFLHQRK